MVTAQGPVPNEAPHLGVTLDHVAFPIRDVPASRSFYGEVLGLRLSRALSGDDWDGLPWLMMIFELAEQRTLALCAFAGVEPAEERPTTPAEARHLALRAGSLEELAFWRARLEAHGSQVSQEDHGDQLSLYFADPNGVLLEITAYRRDAVTTEAAPDDVVSAWLERYGRAP